MELKASIRFSDFSSKVLAKLEERVSRDLTYSEVVADYKRTVGRQRATARRTITRLTAENLTKYYEDGSWFRWAMQALPRNEVARFENSDNKLHEGTLKELARGKGDIEHAHLVHYRFHMYQDDTQLEFADNIDRYVFRKPLRELGEAVFHTPRKYIERVLDFGPLKIQLCEDVPKKQELQAAYSMNSMRVEGEFSILKALTWKSGLTDVVGRVSELSRLSAWVGREATDADSSYNVKIALISGPGGAGKTRLAHEFCSSLDERCWTIFYVPRNPQEVELISSSPTGLIIVVDYPEEQVLGNKSGLTFADEILRAASRSLSFPIPIRVILLSRNSAEYWRKRSDTLFVEAVVIELLAVGSTSLPIADAASILKTACRRVADAIGVAPPNILNSDSWLAAKPEHRLPLFAAAAGLHAALTGEGQLSIGGSELMLELAHRELSRVRGVSNALGLEVHDLERLMALSVLTPSGLSQKTISELHKLGQIVQIDDRNLVDLVRKTSWWGVPDYDDNGSGQGCLQRIEPDRPAAAFLIVALLQDVDYRLVEWLRIVFSQSYSSSASVISRVCFDVAHVSPVLSLRLEDLAVKSIQVDAGSSEAFFDVAQQEPTEYSANFFARLLKIQADQTSDHLRRGVLHRKRSEALYLMGQLSEAFEEIQLSIASFFQKFDGEDPMISLEIAKSNHQKAMCLLQEQHHKSAHEVLEESERRLQWAIQQNDDQAIIELIKVRNRKVQILITLKNFSAAIALCKKTLKLSLSESSIVQSELRSANIHFKDAKIETLALFSNVLAKNGENISAIEHARAVNSQLRELEVIQPDARTAKLATSYQDLANLLFKTNDLNEAIGAIDHATSLFSKLCALRPEAFKYAYTNCLLDKADLHLANCSYQYASDCVVETNSLITEEAEIDARRRREILERSFGIYDRATELGKLDRHDIVESAREDFAKAYGQQNRTRKDWMDLHIPATRAFLSHALPSRWQVEWCSPPLVDFHWRDLSVQEAIEALVAIEIASETESASSMNSRFNVQRVRTAELEFSSECRIYEIQLSNKSDGERQSIATWILGGSHLFDIRVERERLEAFLRSSSSVDAFSSFEFAKFYSAYCLNFDAPAFQVVEDRDMEVIRELAPVHVGDRLSKLRQLNGDGHGYHYLVWSLKENEANRTELTVFSDGRVDRRVVETVPIRSGKNQIKSILDLRKMYFE